MPMFMTRQEAAAVCRLAPETFQILAGYRVAPEKTNKRGGVPEYYDLNVQRFAESFPDPNAALPARVRRPLFALHDDGRWWPLLSKEESKSLRKHRYFTGKPCNAGHVVKRYTKSDKCVDCCQAANGKPTSKEKRIAKNSSAQPGCNLP